MLASANFTPSRLNSGKSLEESSTKDKGHLVMTKKMGPGHSTPRIREGHPEVSFAAMNGGAAIPVGKRTPEGELLRLQLLRNHFGDAPEGRMSKFPKSAHNDVIDAFVMLWTARRIAKGCHQILGGEIASHGIRAQITI
jgi:predicted RNase H-like nuclease